MHVPQHVYRWMLDQLLETRPVTMKVPGREGGYVRVPIQTNPEWYRWLCRNHLSTRRRFPKPRTLLKRCDVLKALVLLADGQKIETLNAQRIREVAEKYLDSISADREVDHSRPGCTDEDF